MPDEFAVSGTFKIDVNHLVGRELTSAMVTVRADTVAEWREIIREAIAAIPWEALEPAPAPVEPVVAPAPAPPAPPAPAPPAPPQPAPAAPAAGRKAGGLMTLQRDAVCSEPGCLCPLPAGTQARYYSREKIYCPGEHAVQAPA